MPDAKDGLGIVSHSSKLVKKLGKENSLFEGSFELCSEVKAKFIREPRAVQAILEAREKDAENQIKKLIKKHK